MYKKQDLLNLNKDMNKDKRRHLWKKYNHVCGTHYLSLVGSELIIESTKYYEFHTLDTNLRKFVHV